jgi:hypothetical protein
MDISPGTIKKISDRFDQAQARLVLQTSDLPLGTLAHMVDAGSIDLQPSFQRRERWSAEKQSALIESFLLNVPVPPIYLSEESNGTYSAIDGKQRLKAIAEFFGNRLKLNKLEKFSEAEGLIFSELPIEIKNAFTLRPFLRVVTLLKQTDRTLKFEVFLRLNRGGEKLGAQEIRNVAYRGPMNNAIYDLASLPFLRNQLKIVNEKSFAYRAMSDAELVLRFLALEQRDSKYTGNLSREMDEFCAEYQDAKSEIVTKKRKLFVDALARCEGIWGANSFKRPDKGAWRDQLLSGMYDAQMLAVSKLQDHEYTTAVQNSDKIVEATRDLFNDESFDEAVRTGTNTPQRLDYRVKKMREVLI